MFRINTISIGASEKSTPGPITASDELVVLAQIRYLDSVHICLSDELKAIFGIEKNGTHSLVIGRQRRVAVIIRPRLRKVDGNLIFAADMTARSLSVSDSRCSDHLEYHLRVIMVFREIMGLKTADSDIILIPSPTQRRTLLPLSINEVKLINRLDHNILPARMRQRWLASPPKNYTLGEVAARIFRYVPIEQAEGKDVASLGEIVHLFRSQCQKVIERINPDLIFVLDYITERLKQLLVSIDPNPCMESNYDFNDILGLVPETTY